MCEASCRCSAIGCDLMGTWSSEDSTNDSRNCQCINTVLGSYFSTVRIDNVGIDKVPWNEYNIRVNVRGFLNSARVHF